MHKKVISTSKFPQERIYPVQAIRKQGRNRNSGVYEESLKKTPNQKKFKTRNPKKKTSLEKLPRILLETQKQKRP